MFFRYCLYAKSLDDRGAPMPARAKIMPVAAAILFAALVAQSAPAAAQQQNPFVGTWGTSLRLPNGSGYAAFVDFYANGAVHLSGVVTGGGQPIHLCGAYRFTATALGVVYNNSTPKLCSMGMCEPPPVALNQPQTMQYRFPNANELLLSTGDHYVRQPANPF